MGKPKRETALFDLLTDGEQTPTQALNAPDRKGRSGAGTSDVDSRGPVAHQGAITDSAAAASDVDATFFELDGDRIRLSFSSISAGVAVFAAMALLVVAFEVGRRSGTTDGFRRGHAAGRDSYAAEAVSEIAQARQQPPATRLVGTLLDDAEAGPTASDSVGGPSTASPRSKWIRENTYVVVQEFGVGRRGDALRAKAFLAERGIATEIVMYPRGTMQLVTAQGYDRSDSTQRQLADELKRKVREFGAAYFAGGGGYRLEGYFKTLKTEDW